MTGLMHHSRSGTARGKVRLYGYLHSVRVQRVQNHEHSQDFGNCRPYRCVCKVSPDAVASTKSKYDVFTIIGFEGSIDIEESLGEERVWIWVPGFIVRHGPSGQLEVSSINLKGDRCILTIGSR
jgi:hypothetical protein